MSNATVGGLDGLDGERAPLAIFVHLSQRGDEHVSDERDRDTVATEQYAFIEKSKVPNREAWQAAIRDCGFDFELDPQLKPFEDSGFCPCKMEGRDTGVEIYYDDLAETMGDESAETIELFSNLADGRDCCISFRWGGSMVECASAMIASYALAKHFGAVVSYEGEAPSDLESFLEETRAVVQEALAESG